MTRISKFNTLSSLRSGEGFPMVVLLLYSLGSGLFIAFLLTYSLSIFLSRFHYGVLGLSLPIMALISCFVLAPIKRRRAARNPTFERDLTIALILLTTAFAISLKWSTGTANELRHDVLCFLMVGLLPGLLWMNFKGFQVLSRTLYTKAQVNRLRSLIEPQGDLMLAFAYLLFLILVPQLKHNVVLVAIGGLLLCLVAILLADSGDGGQPEKQEVFHKALSPSYLDTDKERKPQIGLLFWAVTTLCLLYFLFLSQLQGFAVIFEDAESQAGATGQLRYLLQNDINTEWTFVSTLLSLFLLVLSIISVFFKHYISSRLVRNFGLKFGLSLAPLIVLVGGVSAGLTVAIEGNPRTMILLVQIVFVLVWTTIHKPCTRVLSLILDGPIRRPFRERLAFRITPLAQALTGLALFCLTLLNLPEWIFVAVLLPSSAYWLWYARLAHRHYQNFLKNQLALPNHLATAPSLVNSWRQALSHTPLAVRQTALNTLTQMDPELLEQFLASSLDLEGKEVRLDALRRITKLRLVNTYDTVKRIRTMEITPRVQTLADEALRRMESVTSRATLQEKVEELTFSKRRADRRFAAMLLARDGVAASKELLFKLFWDKDPSVKHMVVVAAGRSGWSEFRPYLINWMETPMFSRVAANALANTGVAILGDLEKDFANKRTPLMLRIIDIYGRIEGPEAETLLVEKINFPIRTVAHQALLMLHRRGYQPTRQEAVFTRIEEVVRHIVWAYAAMLDVTEGKVCKQVILALEAEVRRDYADLFMLLSFVSNKHVIQDIRELLKKQEARDAHITELTRVATPPELRHLLVPILEQLPPARTLSRFYLVFPQELMGCRERLKEMLRQGRTHLDSWTRSCVLDALAKTSQGEISAEVTSCLAASNTMVKEMAAWAIHEIDPDHYEEKMAKWRYPRAEKVDQIIRGVDTKGSLLAFHKILALADNPLFDKIPLNRLSFLASAMREYRLEEGRQLVAAGKRPSGILIVIQGGLALIKDGVTQATVNCFGQLTGNSPYQVITAEATRLILMSHEAMFDLMADFPHQAPRMICAMSGGK